MQLIVGTARVAVFASLEDKIVNMFLEITNTVTYLLYLQSSLLPYDQYYTVIAIIQENQQEKGKEYE